MPYIMARLFAGSSDQSPEQLDRIACQELVPQLLQIPGLLRYSTVQFTDGRVGSFSVYENREAAERGLRVASEWVSITEAVRNYKLDETLRGEMVYTLVGRGNQMQRNAYVVARIYETIARAEDIARALQDEAAEVLSETTPGLIRYSLVRLDDGHVGAFSAFEDQKSAQQITEYARELRSKAGSQLRRFLPADPELYEGIMLGTYTPDQRQGTPGVVT
jgi:quinol monooxygenase YgiN